MNPFERLLSKWSDGFYVEPVYLLCELIALITGLVFVRKDKVGLFFIVYISLDLILLYLDNYLFLFPNISKIQYGRFVYFTNSLVAIVELSVYYYFFYTTLKSVFVKKFIIITYPVYILTAFLLITSFGSLNSGFRYIANRITIVEFILLIFLCFAYYLELFKKPIVDLFKRPSFFITTGIFFFSIVSIPFYSISHLFATNQQIYDFKKYEVFFQFLFYVPFSVNFLFLAKAFLCRKHLTI